MDGWMDGCMDGRTDGWLDRCMEGGMDGGRDRSMDRSMESFVDARLAKSNIPTHPQQKNELQPHPEPLSSILVDPWALTVLITCLKESGLGFGVEG